MFYCYHESPIGRLLLAGTKSGLELIGFPEGKGRVAPEQSWVEDSSLFTKPMVQLTEYFDGERTTFDLDLIPNGTDFQLQVLTELQNIPFGETRSYQDLASAISRPKAVRAVGAANGRNPLPIVIPCHRVIGADGSLTGFGGGLPAKLWLLEHEGLRHVSLG